MRLALTTGVEHMITPDGRYFIVRGRLWRMTNPQLSRKDRAAHTRSLMAARRAVAAALRSGDETAVRAARRDVHRAKVALGERGRIWWSDGAPDYNRRLVQNTPYHDWYERALLAEKSLLALLAERDRSASACPSEVARRIAPDGWRRHMGEVRDAARRLAHRGVVAVMQRGKVLDPDDAWRGPIRIRRIE